MIRYKLVTQDYKTRKGKSNETTWEVGATGEATGDPTQGLCTDGWLHCYDSPELAVFLNPIHANIEDPRMLVVKAHGRGKNDHGLKRGYRSMTPTGEIDCPQPTRIQRVAFGILCAKAVCKDAQWNAWADKWLSGEDRSGDAATVDAAYTARTAAYAAAARTAAYAAAAHAAYAAAAYAARDAAYASAYVAARGAYAARFAARYAAYAAYADTIDLVAIAREAMTY